MARWDDLHRAIAARDHEGAERIWLELLETDLESLPRLLEASRAMAGHSGGKRQAGLLLWMLAETLKEKGRAKDLIPVYVHLARMGPDDGTVRTGLVAAAREAYGERADLEGLLEKSGMAGGENQNLPVEAERLERYLELEPGAYVYHRGGWGVGRIVGYLPERGRCVIDFRGRAGHEMDLDAAAERLERLEANDVRAMSMADPTGLRRWAAEDPLEMIRQVLSRFSNRTKLRHVKDALVPDAVATSRWSSWWQEAKKRAHLDPRFHVGGGRDPILEYDDKAAVDFRTQVERRFSACATVEERQKASREFLQTVAKDPSARETLAELVNAERNATRRPSLRLGWDLLLAALEGRDEQAALHEVLLASPDPKALLAAIPDDDARGIAARGLVQARPDGTELLYDAVMDQDDPVLADAGVDRFGPAGRPDLVARMLDEIDARAAMLPNLWAWYVRGLRRDRWDGRSFEPYALLARALKVIDAVEYRSRRGGSARDKSGVSALTDVLTARHGALIREAAEATDDGGALHLIRVLEQNRGLKGRVLQRIQAIILRTRPNALKSRATVATAEEDLPLGDRLDRIYMTPEGMARLRAERDKIVNEEMPANAQEIARAREFGDLSENAEYHAAREKQGLLQARADVMNGELARALPLTADLVRTDAVTVGSRVHLKSPNGEHATYTLLGPPDVDVKRGIINYLTPLAQALMGRRPGEHVRVALEGGNRDFQILEIENGLVG